MPLTDARGKANKLFYGKLMKRFYKTLTFAAILSLCGILLVLWSVVNPEMDKTLVQRGKDTIQTRQAGYQLFTMFSFMETKQESHDRATVSQVIYPIHVEQAIQIASDGRASKEQMQDGITVIRNEAAKLHESGKEDEAMGLEIKAIEIEAKRMELEARDMELITQAMERGRGHQH